MTPEQPHISLRHPRPGPAARRRALGLAESVPATRESLRDSLARIPDLDDDVGTPNPLIKAALAAGPAIAAPSAASDMADPGPASTVAAPSDVPLAGDDVFAPAAPTAPAPATGRKGRISPPPKPPLWRRMAFALVLLGLVASIPFLGYQGYQVIERSTDGQTVGDQPTPTDPGFEAQVDPTPTAVAIQYDNEGKPNAVTFIALAGADGGGAVIFVPLDTEVTEPSFGVDRLRTAYNAVADRPALARERLASQVGRLLNVGIDEIIDLGNEGWSQLVEPVAPIEIDSPTEVKLADGTQVPIGPVTLTADQAGQYLAARNYLETDLTRLNRHAVIWEGWLDKVAASSDPNAVPGESEAGVGRFARALAAGPVSYDTLPVETADAARGTWRRDEKAVNELITNTVASPTGAVPGSRFTVRLLNGVSPDSIPSDLVRQVVGRGGAVTILGNGPQFDTDKTEVVYANPDNKDVAELVAKSIGATGSVRLDREAPDTVDLTIVLGRDILGDATGDGPAGATTPDATTPGG